MNIRCRIVSTVLCLLAVVLLASSSATAQTGAASLTGIVTDATGSTVPGATVTATNQATNVTYTAVSNEAGNYTVTSLPVGTYVVKAELSSFKTAATKPIQVEAKQIVRLDFKLELGALARDGRGQRRVAGAADRVGDGRRGHLRHDARRRCRSTAATPASSRCCCRAP